MIATHARPTRPLGLIALVVAAFTLLVPASLAEVAPEAQPMPARIGGVVSDANGDPVEGAFVQLINRRGDVVRRARTDENGIYAFTVRPGRYIVRAAKRDIGRDRARVGVRGGGTARVPLTLE